MGSKRHEDSRGFANGRRVRINRYGAPKAPIVPAICCIILFSNAQQRRTVRVYE